MRCPINKAWLTNNNMAVRSELCAELHRLFESLRSSSLHRGEIAAHCASNLYTLCIDRIAVDTGTYCRSCLDGHVVERGHSCLALLIPQLPIARQFYLPKMTEYSLSYSKQYQLMK